MPLRPIPLCLSLFLAGTLLAPPPAAAESCNRNKEHCECGDTVGESRKLTQDLETCPDVGLRLASGVTLDCNGFAIRGRSSREGILLQGVDGARVRNCDVSGFRFGIRVRAGRSSLISSNKMHGNHRGLSIGEEAEDIHAESNFITDNREIGILVNPDTRNTHIYDNTVSDNGRRNLDIRGAKELLLDRNVVGGRTRYDLQFRHVHEAQVRSNEFSGGRIQIRGNSDRNNFLDNRVLVADPLLWRNSWERQHYAEGEWKPVEGLRLWGNLRYALNQQQGGVLIEGRDLGRDEISLWTSVLKAEYAWQPTRNWSIFGQLKSLFLRRERDSQTMALADERTFVPIVKARYTVTPRTELWLGMQGFPGVPMQVDDRADGFNSRDEKVWVAQVTNRSPYLGYDVAMNLGFMLTNRDYDLASREIDDMNVASVYMRAILGYSL